MEEERLIELLTKKISGVLTPSDQIELSEYERDSYYGSRMIFYINKIKEVSVGFDPKIVTNLEKKSFASISRKINQPIYSNKKAAPLIYIFRTAAVAALLILIAMGSFFIYKKELRGENSKQIFLTQKGSKSQLVLPDGSKVWLNADTRLTYDKSFGKITRDVYLSGEAFFDVSKDKNHPFIVHTNTIDIKVLGTAFNVKAYTKESTTQTTLLRGAVEIFLKNGGEKISLKPNEKMILQNSYVNTNKPKQADENVPAIAIMHFDYERNDSATIETEWVKNKLAFKNETMIDLIPKLERWYDVHIVLKKNINNDKKFTGTFDNDKIEDVLESLKMFEKFNYTINKNEIIIY